MVEFRSEERQAPPPPQPHPFDLDGEDLGRQQVDDDQETLFAEPVTKQRLDVPEEVERPDQAKDLAKTIAQMQMQMKEKGIDAPLDYTELDLHKGSDPLP